MKIVHKSLLLKFAKKDSMVTNFKITNNQYLLRIYLIFYKRNFLLYKFLLKEKENYIHYN